MSSEHSINRKMARPATAAKTAKALKEHLSIICSLSLFSIFGEAARIILEQLFGQACHLNNVGWNKSSWAPCTTDPGSTWSTGGALFIDLPVNMVGCFIMGLFTSGDEYVGTAVARILEIFLILKVEYQSLEKFQDIPVAECGL